jgi:hypothetical protein
MVDLIWCHAVQKKSEGLRQRSNQLRGIGLTFQSCMAGLADSSVIVRLPYW